MAKEKEKVEDLYFENTEINAGVFIPGVSVSCLFKKKEGTNKVIERVVPSCSCISANVDKSGNVFVRFKISKVLKTSNTASKRVGMKKVIVYYKDSNVQDFLIINYNIRLV